MNKHLLKDVPELVKAEVISEETGLKIAKYYELKKQSAPNNLVVVLGILGALLVGSGVVLIVAHNWDELCLGSFTKQEDALFEWLFLLYCNLFCVYYFIGRSPYFRKRGIMANPFLSTGIIGILIILLSWSFEYLWKDL